MNKQAISVTLSPDNLVWLKGRARAEGRSSMSEFLDALITRARFGTTVPRPVHSMRGALAGSDDEVSDDPTGLPAAAWQAWQAKWDALLEGVPEAWPTRGRRSLGRRPAPSMAVAERRVVVHGKRRRG
jgi:hypothetical protein